MRSFWPEIETNPVMRVRLRVDDAGRVGGRPQGGEDFGAAEIGGGHRAWFSFRGGDADSVAAQWQGLRKAVQA